MRYFEQTRAERRYLGPFIIVDPCFLSQKSWKVECVEYKDVV